MCESFVIEILQLCSYTTFGPLEDRSLLHIGEWCFEARIVFSHYFKDFIGFGFGV